MASVTLLAVAGTAQAFSFTSEVEGSSAKGDIFLKAVILNTGERVAVEDLSFVMGAEIVSNDEFKGGNTGAASADKGDEATTGIAQEDAAAADIVTNLSTANLNNIVDTEDEGNFQIDLDFAKVIDNLLIWERGKNSDLGVQAVDNSGNLIGNFFKVTRSDWTDAGFSIDTTEIGSAQAVGSFGLNLVADLGVSGPVSKIRFSSESGFNGPDWKFVGTAAERESQSVPEPGLAVGLGLLGGLMLTKRTRLA
ncbi:MAG: PEP-CTERM sorting domain-containing protein [Leptolyngbyaceae cyanobacterium SM1_1_3]|nr:PEP-CTERM sorting domain-containing protein [Leptolyngbyaceae cyanobacterium SM1_1_3]NJN01055.1 PEP-CTERM sorting domain-containing protein [Leptolyngbyaceae cyanobacterium RM1_1_2]NJO11946.1 PEP-CTERM sorting domain-containing protein [Leptolyngbyaceae cyanobacterium SL_1_1]